MSVFARYDILDMNNNRVAEGHKASFCLEDVQCIPEKEKKYQCKGFGDQGEYTT
jgi:lysyl oxidase-like protein 2/3/4